MARPGLKGWLAVAVGVAVAVACSFGIDSDRARFSCTADSECGGGFECKPQLSGGGLCFRAGDCSAEVCDGQDNDCNGAIDDSVPGDGEDCASGLLGVCSGGVERCEQGAARCV